MGLIARSASLSRSHSTTAALGAGFVGSLSTLESTRYFPACQWIPKELARTSLSRDKPATNRPDPRCRLRLVVSTGTGRREAVQSRSVGPAEFDLARECRRGARFDPCWKRLFSYR